MAGIEPQTSPPIFMPGFDPHAMDSHALLFFKLHGLAGQPYWYGDGGATACSAAQIRQARLDGALVFAANCWGGAQSPMVQALLAAGAACVVTGEGVNYAGVRRIDGADVIGWVWRQLIERGFSAGGALEFGKLGAGLKRPALLADIASFSLVGRGDARLRERAYGSDCKA